MLNCEFSDQEICILLAPFAQFLNVSVPLVVTGTVKFKSTLEPSCCPGQVLAESSLQHFTYLETLVEITAT